MRRDASAALTIAKNRPKIGVSAGRSSTASFGRLDGGRTRARTWEMIHFPALQAIAATGAPRMRIIVAPKVPKTDHRKNLTRTDLKASGRASAIRVMGAPALDLSVRRDPQGTNIFSLRPPRPQPRPLLAKDDRFVNC
jgi:hypothetical protein